MLKKIFILLIISIGFFLFANDTTQSLIDEYIKDPRPDEEKRIKSLNETINEQKKFKILLEY